MNGFGLRMISYRQTSDSRWGFCRAIMPFMDALRYKPSALWVLDTMTDYTGNANVATLSGTERHGVALVPEADFSQVLKGGSNIDLPGLIYVQGKESQSFSIIATFVVIFDSGTGRQQVVSHNGQYDGLTVDGTVISFSTEYAGTGEAKCSYDCQYIKKITAVAVHTEAKNSLFINGELVAEVTISAEQRADTYKYTGGLEIGNTTSSQGLMINQVGLYKSVLMPEQISRLYAQNNRRADGDVPKMFNGESIPVGSVRPLFLDIAYATKEDWEGGIFTSATAEEEVLVPNMTNGLTLAGKWEDTIDISYGTATSIDSINMSWNGENVGVEASLDGTTWTTVNRGENLSIIPSGFNPLGKSLSIRISFTEGVEDAWIDSLQINGYLSDTVTPLSGRPLTYLKAVNFDDMHPLNLREDMGVKLFGGEISVSPDTGDEGYVIKTVEAWIKRNNLTNPTLSFTPTTTYVNGVDGATAGVGEWALYHYTIPSGITNFDIAGTITIGALAVYDTTVSAITAAKIYSNYKGAVKFSEDDASIVAITEPATSADIYAHDWEIVTA